MPESPRDSRPHPVLRESLSIILAAYGESENLALLLPELRAVIRSIDVPADIIVVDTQTALDRTEEVCAANRVRHVRRGPTDEYGDAIRTGIRASSGDYVLVMDADGSHNPEFVREMWRQRHRAEVVIASRYMSGGRTDNPWVLVGMSRVLNMLFRALVRFPVLDVSNSFRLYRGEALRSLQLDYRHFDVLEEILAKLLWRGERPARILEIPYHFERRRNGDSKRSLLVFGFHFCIAAFRLHRMHRRLRKGRLRDQADPVA